jgi:hypothetical protein
MLFTSIVIFTLAVLYWFPVRRWFGRWGTTEEDLTRSWPGIRLSPTQRIQQRTRSR